MFRILALIVAALAVSVAAAADTVDVEFAGDRPGDELRETVQDALPDENTPKTSLEARRQGRRAADAVRSALNSQGYYDPQIDLAVLGTDAPTARLRIDTGPRFALANVRVSFRGEAPTEEDQEKIRNDLPVKSGRPAIPSNVIDAERWIANTLREAGYPYAEVEERRVVGDRDAETLSVTYETTAGPRVVFGETRFPTDDIKTKASYLRRLVPYETGEVYEPAELSLLNTRLAETRMFRVARASLASEPSGTTENGDQIRDVEITLTERPRNTVGLGGKYSTSEGFGLSAELTRRNLTRRGDVLNADLTIAELEQSLEVTWRRPNEFGYGRGLIFSAGINNETTDAYDRQAISIGAGYEVVKGPDFSYSYGVQGEITKEEDEYGERDLQIISVYADARLDKTDSVLDPRSGWRANGRVEPSYAFGDDVSPFVRSVGQVSAYVPFDDDRRFVLAGRFKAGAVVGADVENLPVDTRFYSGGGGSVRGYAYQAIGPRADDGTPLGGTSVLEASIEGRYAVRPNIGVVAFLDAGTVSTNQFSDFSDARFGAGIGVRYTTPAGPIRLDVATPLNPTDFDDPVQIYISIGQAF
ncbi:autotransporter assembly complex protein TamA [Henriciella marina]|uniref:autotransporter assembly complex protein TamA n=1 Tax=Henriciella marina TaxID=453851 RepID=UPI000376A60D|nr:autotransporter assembly complex family protein [Henriciella marina]